MDPSESATVTVITNLYGVEAKGSDNLPFHPYGPL